MITQLKTKNFGYIEVADFDNENNWGLEVYYEGKLIGELYGEEVPDESDPDYVVYNNRLIELVENVLIENQILL
jgi:hypothetical protein